MSRRLVADKSPNGQTLRSLESYAHMRGPKESGAPKEKPRNRKRSQDADAPPPRGSQSPVRSPQQNKQFPPHPEKNDFRKSIQKNVFIDSYYPVVQGDCSEASRKSRSSCEHIDKHDVSTEKSEGPWQTDSGETYKHFLTDSNSSDPPPPNTNRSRPSSNILTICPTLDSQTYTLLSCSSDLDSTFLNISQPLEDPSRNTPDDDHNLPSTIGCFTQLYRRIHNLEDLLQQTITHSVHPRKNKCKQTIAAEGEGAKPVRKTFPRVKAQGKAKAWESTCLSIPEVTDEKGNSDTDNEIRSIKKRLKVLEKKLKKTKHLPPSLPLHRDPQEPPTSSSLVFTGKGCDRSGDTESTVPPHSETESFLQSELLLLNGGSFDKSDGDSWDRKTKTKVRKKFISKCRGIRKKCSGLVSSGRKISSKNKVSTTSGWSEVLYKHSILTEESVEATLLSQSFSTHTKTDSSTVVYWRCQHEGLLEPSRKPRKKNGKKRKYLCKKSSKTNIFSVHHRADTPAKEIMLTSTPNTHAFLFGDCDLPPAATLKICDHDNNARPPVFDKNVWTGSLWKNNPVDNPPTWDPHPLWIPCPPADWPQEGCNCTLKAVKPPKNRISFRNPLDLLKRGGKLRIPVLFEEVCKTPDSKDLGHKLSNVSMRFVVVEEDSGHPLTPLRRLVNRLSQTKPPQKGDQFVFGVSKCRCDNPQVQDLSSMSRRNVTSGFS